MIPLILSGKGLLMRSQLQHLLHPLNLWCRCGGNFTFIFKFYEAYCWRPLLRKLLINDGFIPNLQTTNDSCRHFTALVNIDTIHYSLYK
jgi:hypothetical protein